MPPIPSILYTTTRVIFIEFKYCQILPGFLETLQRHPTEFNLKSKLCKVLEAASFLAYISNFISSYITFPLAFYDLFPQPGACQINFVHRALVMTVPFWWTILPPDLSKTGVFYPWNISSKNVYPRRLFLNFHPLFMFPCSRFILSTYSLLTLSVPISGGTSKNTC